MNRGHEQDKGLQMGTCDAFTGWFFKLLSVSRNLNPQHFRPRQAQLAVVWVDSLTVICSTSRPAPSIILC